MTCNKFHVQDHCIRDKTILPEFKPSSLSIHTRDVADVCTLSRNKMIHRGRNRCFSIQPVMKCSPTCRPAQIEHVTLGFHCVLDGPLSDQLRNAIHIRPLIEMASQEATNNVVFGVPTSCVPVASNIPKWQQHQH